MNKIEANISLFIITFFVAVQYIFLAGVPEDLSHFAFLCITNLIGFVMIFAFFFGELFRLDVRQIFQSAILSSELIGFNLFMLMGLRDVDPAITSAVLSSYFVFVLLLDAILKRKFPNKLSIISVLTVLTGLLLMTNADIKGLFNIGILYLLIADVFFAIYVINVGSYAKSSNPSILAMGQMFFCFVFSLILWGGEAVLTGIKFSLPTNKDFWVGVIYISFFIRGLYAIIQIYAQRYVSPLNTSLIFSSEIVMTMIISPLISKIFDTAADAVTPLRIAGSIFIVLGLLIMEPGFFKSIKNLITPHKMKLKQKHPIKTSKKIFLIVSIAFIYALVDIPVVMTDFLPNYAGIKNAMPFITGLFFGFYGVMGCCLGTVISSIAMSEPLSDILWECWCVMATGFCMFYGWHYLSRSHSITFKKPEHYIRYFLLLIAASILCVKPDYMLSYFVTGILIGLPANILFGSLLYVEPILPSWCDIKYDAEFELNQGTENLDNVNEILETAAEIKHIDLKRIFETQSCLEELSIRIFHAIPDTKIKVSVIYSNAISMRFEYKGVKYNPFKINKNEGVLDIVSLKIIKHRALRASFFYIEGENKIHVVL